MTNLVQIRQIFQLQKSGSEKLKLIFLSKTDNTRDMIQMRERRADRINRALSGAVHSVRQKKVGLGCLRSALSLVYFAEIPFLCRN